MDWLFCTPHITRFSTRTHNSSYSDVVTRCVRIRGYTPSLVTQSRDAWWRDEMTLARPIWRRLAWPKMLNFAVMNRRIRLFYFHPCGSLRSATQSSWCLEISIQQQHALEILYDLSSPTWQLVCFTRNSFIATISRGNTARREM